MRKCHTISCMAVLSLVVSMAMVVSMVMLFAVGHVDADVNISMTYKQQTTYQYTYFMRGPPRIKP